MEIKTNEENQNNKYISSKTITLKNTFGDSGSEILSLRFNGDDTYLAAGTSDGQIIIFSLITGKIKKTIITSQNSTPITVLRWRPRTYPSKSPNILVSGNSDGTITHWHINSGKYLTKITEEENQILALDYTKSGFKFASAGKDFKIRIYDEATKIAISQFDAASWQSPGHGNRIFSLKFIPHDENTLLSGGWDGNVLIWDIREKKSVGSFFGASLSGDSLDFKDDLILTGSHRHKNYLELWDFKTLKKLENIEWDNDSIVEGAYVYAAQFNKFCRRGENLIMAGCSGINEIKIFDCNQNYKAVFKAFDFKKGIYSVDFANNSDIFAFSGGDGLSFIYSMKL